MWFYNGEVFQNIIEEFDSFVYLIERTNVEEDDVSPIFYVGKKTFFNKSKYKGKRIIVESDWWDYYGSSEQLSEDVERYGKNNFKRHILHLCRTKGDAGYLEAKEHFDRNVLHIDSDGKKLYYNKNIFGRYQYEPTYYKVERPVDELCAYDNMKTKTKVRITNGKQNRIVSKKIAEELTENGHWTEGVCKKHDSLYINNNSIVKNEKCAELYMISVVKEDKLIWIKESELETKLSEGWKKFSETPPRIFYVNDGNKQKLFFYENDKNDFLSANDNWEEGQISEENYNTSDVSFMTDMRTGERVAVTDKKDKYLTSVKTRTVKIKSKNRIIFRGYLELFLMENPDLPKKQFREALKSGDTSVLSFSKAELNDMKYTISYEK